MSVRRRVYAPPAPKLPPGLLELMDGLARDVLKNNPDNIYEFCAQHMQTLLKLRDGYAPKLAPFMTLEQKIAKAQKIVKERAEQRRQAYDEKLRTESTILNKSELSSVPSDPCDVIEDSESPKKNEKALIETLNEEQKEIPHSICQETILITAASEQIEDDNTSIVDTKNQDTLNISLNNEEHAVVDESHSDDTAKDNDDTDEQEQKPPEEKDILNETRNVVLEVNTQNVSSNDLNDALTKDQDEPVKQDETNDNTDNEITTTQAVDSQLQKEGTENNTQCNNEIVIDTDTTITKDASVEMISSNDVNENIAPPTITVTSGSISDITEEESPITEINELETQKLPEDSPNEKNNEALVIDEIKKETLETHTEDLKREDDEILAVILSKSVGTELHSIQENESSSAESNESAQKTIQPEQPLDPESAAEQTDNKASNINSSMDLETAAITIQKVFRSFLFKTKTVSYDDPTTVDINLLTEDKEKEENEGLNIQLKDRRSLGISRMDTVLQTVNEEKSLSLSTDDSSTLSSAATIIQAHVRGFLVRNKFNLNNKTTSTNSLIDSDAPSIPSLEADSDNRKSKTVLNIHIVPEGHFVSRDESILTSMDLSLDSSPPSSINLHPLGYDKSERRKQLKREDAIQSVSPPSNNSGKLSDDLDSVKEVIDNTEQEISIIEEKQTNNSDVIKADNVEKPTVDVASDETDVITPFESAEDKSSRESNSSSKLLHSGEFHDIVVPTNVTRSDSSVVREFQNVLVYFILWNN